MGTSICDLRARRRANLKRLLRPRQIAFVGGRHLENCIALARRAGYGGKIHVVNPTREEIAGIPCVPSLDALPRAPDAAFVALSRERTIPAMADLARIGAGGAVCHAAGFSELGASGRDLQRELTAAAGDLAMVGPNCMGVLNAFDRVALWGADGHLEPRDGPGVAFISQSGAFLYGIVNAERAYPMGYGLSLGNQAAIDFADALDVVLDDERVRVIGLYCEGLADGMAFGDALTRAIERGVPVVLLAGGGVPAAAARSVSHTGNLAVPGDFWHALAERYGLIEVATLKQLIETTKLLAISGPPRGRRAFIVTHSGGAGSLIAEQAPRLGLELPPVTPENHDRISHVLPEVISIANPLDLNLPWSSSSGMSLEDTDLIAQCLIDGSAGETDSIAMLLDVPRAGEGHDAPWLPSLEAMVEVRRRSGLPTIVAGLLPEGLEPDLRARMQAQGVAALMGASETIEAMAGAARYAEARGGLAANPPARLLPAAADGQGRPLDEWDSKERLAPYGLNFPPRRAGAAEEAPKAAAEVGFPVALKVLNAEIAHKSKLGGVRLHLRSETEVAEAVGSIQAQVARARPGTRVDRFLVEAMVPDPLAELILGVKCHPALGLALLVGRGGVDAELQRDYGMVLLPASDRALERSLDRLRHHGLNDEARQSVLAALRAVARFAKDHAGELVEMDVNPLLVLRDGSVVAVDALLVLGEEHIETGEAP